jgi:D-sedoheptulose 7-phosphate isomerase
MYDEIEHYWHELASIMQAMPFDVLTRAAGLLLNCYRRGSTVFIVGNGGSAATASHFTCDLAKGTQVKGMPAFRVISLNDNVPLMSAWANDTHYEHIFAEQLATLVRPYDIVIVISASGNSPNILAAARMAKKSGAITLALTGQDGGKLSQLADFIIYVPSKCIEQVEDAHLVIAHSLCVVLRERLRTEALLSETDRPVLKKSTDQHVIVDSHIAIASKFLDSM